MNRREKAMLMRAMDLFNEPPDTMGWNDAIPILQRLLGGGLGLAEDEVLDTVKKMTVCNQGKVYSPNVRKVARILGVTQGALHLFAEAARGIAVIRHIQVNETKVALDFKGDYLLEVVDNE